MDPLIPQDHAEEVALFRAEIVGSLARQALSHGELRRALVELHQRAYRPPGAKVTHRYSVPTLERWYYAYRKGGLEALRPKRRSDAGSAQALTAEERQLVCDIRREHPSASAALIRRTLLLEGQLRKGVLSEPTLRRLYHDEGLDRLPLVDGDGTKTRLRWQAERPGALWHGDVCHGPALVIADKRWPLRIHALLDDASRYIVALEAHHTEQELDMLGLLCRALRRYGASDALYLDNGSTYSGDALRIGCERLGITLLHARPGDAPARGKMERFWRTLRDGCLRHLGACASLHDVQVRLVAFLDEHYHHAPHAGLWGKTPAQVFEVAMAERPPDIVSEARLRQALTVHARRRLRRDNTLSVGGKDWELDQGFLAGRVVTIGRCLLAPDEPPWVEHEGRHLVCHLVDPVANSRRKRPPRRQAKPQAGARTTSFDPAGALVRRAVRQKPEEKRR